MLVDVGRSLTNAQNRWPSSSGACVWCYTAAQYRLIYPGLEATTGASTFAAHRSHSTVSRSSYISGLFLLLVQRMVGRRAT